MLAMTVPAAAKAELAPSGTLRAAINFGNSGAGPARARRQRRAASPPTSRASSPDALGVPVEFVRLRAGRRRVRRARRATRGTSASSPSSRCAPRASRSPTPYVLIEGVYLVPPCVAVRARVRGRPRRHAHRRHRRQRVRPVPHARAQARDARRDCRGRTRSSARARRRRRRPHRGASSRSSKPMRANVAGSRLLPEAFMSIRQAMGTPREREAAAAYLARRSSRMRSARGFWPRRSRATASRAPRSRPKPLAPARGRR